MLIAAAVCPHPPLLIPAAIGAAAGDPPPALCAVGDACDVAVRALAAAEPDLIAVVGGGPAGCEYGAGAAGSLGGYGVPVTVGEGEPVLPLSLTVGRWLLGHAGIGAGPDGQRRGHEQEGHEQEGCDRPGHDRRGCEPQVLLQAVGERAPARDCLTLGAAIAGRAPRVALLAMGDASARRARDTPGAPDPQAQDYDDEVAEALAAADARWLSRLDPALDRELMVAGRAAWQVLAGAAAGTRMCGRLLCMANPYGVTYLVASWEENGAN
jgi:hypothetical protein